MSIDRPHVAPPDSGRQGSRRGGDSWRPTLANLWSELATIRADAIAKGRLTDDPLTWAETVLIGVTHVLCAVADPEWERREYAELDEREDCLWSAASALEAYACVWHELGPVSASPRPHLARRLERHLEDDDRRALSGVGDPRVTRAAVAKAAGAALGAVESLRQERGERAELLVRLEDGAVELAALAVRATLTIHPRGEARAVATRSRSG